MSFRSQVVSTCNREHRVQRGVFPTDSNKKMTSPWTFRIIIALTEGSCEVTMNATWEREAYESVQSIPSAVHHINSTNLGNYPTCHDSIFLAPAKPNTILPVSPLCHHNIHSLLLILRIKEIRPHGDQPILIRPLPHPSANLPIPKMRPLSRRLQHLPLRPYRRQHHQHIPMIARLRRRRGRHVRDDLVRALRFQNLLPHVIDAERIRVARVLHGVQWRVCVHIG